MPSVYNIYNLNILEEMNDIRWHLCPTNEQQHIEAYGPHKKHMSETHEPIPGVSHIKRHGGMCERLVRSYTNTNTILIKLHFKYIYLKIKKQKLFIQYLFSKTIINITYIKWQYNSRIRYIWHINSSYVLGLNVIVLILIQCMA